jgi:hypothetical protein
MVRVALPRKVLALDSRKGTAVHQVALTVAEEAMEVPSPTTRNKWPSVN